MGATGTRAIRSLAALCIALLMLLAGPADARGPHRSRSTSQASGADESQFVEHGHYTNKDGKDVHSPAHTKDGKAPPGASAQCGDGSYSFSQHRSGTCSRHGGVSAWL